MPTFNLWDIGHCNCGCCVTFTVKCGNGAFTFAGATVSVYTSLGGTLLATGTTGVMGTISLCNASLAGSRYVTVTGGGAHFAASGTTLTLTCGGSQTITLSPAAGYHYLPICCWPLPSTLNLTFVICGVTYTGTMTYAAGTWGSGAISPADYNFFLNADGSISISESSVPCLNYTPASMCNPYSVTLVIPAGTVCVTPFPCDGTLTITE